MSSKIDTSNEDNNKSENHNFQIRPTHSQKFNTYLAKEIIQEILLKYLKDKEFSQIEARTYSISIANEIKDKLRDQFMKSRYKLMVQVFLGERHGAGMKVGARCVWDADSDTLAFDQFLNESIFCMAVAFGVYFY